MRQEKIVSLEQKYGIPEKTHALKGRLFHRKVRQAYIEVANIASLEVILTLPSIDQPTSVGSSRLLK